MIAEWLMAFARPLGFVALFPLFTFLSLGIVLRLALAAALAWPLIGVVGEAAILLILKEFFVGALLGAALGIPIWAAQVAGSAIDVFRGTAQPAVAGTDPSAEVPVTAVLFPLTLLAVFVAAGGVRAAVAVIYASYDAWPMATIAPTGFALAAFTADLLAQLLSLAVAMGLPLLAAMAAGEAALAIATRSGRQIGLVDLGLSIKGLAFLLILPGYLLLLARYAEPTLFAVPSFRGAG